MNHWKPTLLAAALVAVAQGCANPDQAMPGTNGDRPNGSECSAAANCASGICNASVCQQRVGATGLANGGMCAMHTDCASGFCVSNVCRATPGPGGTNRPVGAQCSASAECTSNACVGGLCRDPMALDGGRGGRGNGETCTAPADCSSGFCVAGACQATAGGMGRPNGATCTAAGECAGGHCVDGRCSATPGGGGGGGNRPDGAMCQFPSDCASGICTDGTCRASTTADGGAGGRDGGDGSVDATDPTMPPNVETRVEGEICDDGLDNDLDGEVDEGCRCNPGARQQCYPGRPGEAGGTRCNWGSMSCGSNGRWGSCTGFGSPQVEECNGIDDDCDGDVDEECGCPTEGATRSCYAGPTGSVNVGVCRAGAQRCERDMVGRLLWGPCDNMIVPNFESCNGVDDDCDGQTDEGCDCPLGTSRACTAGGTAGTGVCRGGTQRCLPRTEGGGGSAWGACEGAVGPSMETCNGADDDCNGTIDDGCGCTPGQTRECFNGPLSSVGRGACVQGRTTCQPNGTWGACVGAVLPSAELCNMRDDDCDGDVDEGCFCPMGQTPVYRRRTVTMPPMCGMHMGDGGPSLVRSCEPSRCPQGQVAVELTSGSLQCVDAPPNCVAPLQPNYYRASGWVCDRGCEVLIRYGGAFGDRTVCAQRPSETSCRNSCFRNFNPTLEAWQCTERCAGGMAGIRFVGMQLCLPCPNPPGERIRPPD